MFTTSFTFISLQIHNDTAEGGLPGCNVGLVCEDIHGEVHLQFYCVFPVDTWEI